MSEATIYRDAREQRAYAFGRMESRVRAALEQLEHGEPGLALEHLRLALPENARHPINGEAA